MNMKKTMIATRKGQAAPVEDQRVEIYQHHVTFTEVVSESMPQVALNCIVLCQFGLDMSSPWSVFSQLSSLGTSLISVCLAFGKVQGDPNQIFSFQIAVALKLSTSDPILVNLKCV